MVHNHKWQHPDFVDNVFRIRPGFRVSHTKQMVSHSPRNLQRGHLRVLRVVQNRLSGLQCRSLCGSPDHRIKRSIQMGSRRSLTPSALTPPSQRVCNRLQNFVVGILGRSV